MNRKNKKIKEKKVLHNNYKKKWTIYNLYLIVSLQKFL